MSFRQFVSTLNPDLLTTDKLMSTSSNNPIPLRKRFSDTPFVKHLSTNQEDISRYDVKDSSQRSPQANRQRSLSLSQPILKQRKTEEKVRSAAHHIISKQPYS